jgi:hypothetical protein
MSLITRVDPFLSFEITMNDAGHYKMVASKGSQKTNAELMLVVNPAGAPPELGDDLKSVVVNVDEPAMLQITAKNCDKLQWLVDGEPVDEYDEIVHIRNGDTFKLQFNSITPADGGEYTCVAENAYGKSMLSCTLTVNDIPHATSTQLSATGDDESLPYIRGQDDGEVVEVVAGSTLRLTAEVTNPLPGMCVRWMKNDTELEVGKRFKITDFEGTHQLTLSNVSSGDAGFYLLEIEA